MEPEERLKLYVLIRKDILTDIQCGVQAGHAITEYMKKYWGTDCKLTDWANEHRTLIYLAANREELLKKKCCGLPYASFYEPDLGNEETAVAFSPVTDIDGHKIFSDLNLV